jgi:hypothetical protein
MFRDKEAKVHKKPCPKKQLACLQNLSLRVEKKLATGASTLHNTPGQTAHVKQENPDGVCLSKLLIVVRKQLRNLFS